MEFRIELWRIDTKWAWGFFFYLCQFLINFDQSNLLRHFQSADKLAHAKHIQFISDIIFGMLR